MCTSLIKSAIQWRWMHKKTWQCLMMENVNPKIEFQAKAWKQRLLNLWLKSAHVHNKQELEYSKLFNWMNERKRNLHREEVFIGNANESEVLVLFSLLFFFALVNTHAHTHTHNTKVPIQQWFWFFWRRQRKLLVWITFWQKLIFSGLFHASTFCGK